MSAVPTHPTTGPAPVLRVADVRVQIAGSQILHGVSFDVAPTGVTALLGRNGVGKTTTLLAVMGLLPRSGSVTLDSERIDDLPTHKIVQRGVGYVPEDREVFAGLSVAENLRLAERGVAEPRYDAVFELFPDLRGRLGQSAGTLSGGQQQMVALARVLLAENRLLLVDEPTKGLAPQVVAEVAQVLESVARTVPVLLVEQNLGVVARLARRAVVLNQGRVVHDGDASALLADQALTRRLLGVSADTGVVR